MAEVGGPQLATLAEPGVVQVAPCARSISAASRATGRKKRKIRPSTASTASMTLLSPDISGAIEETWKVRASPRRARAAASRSSIGRPSKAMVPASGRISPTICLMSVDLPAPFGPISAWISPG